jgi:hypothetical protein
MKYSPRRSGGWLESACFKTAVLRSSWNDQFYCGKRLIYQARLPKAKRIFLKQDQCGIVAQFFLLCEKVRMEFCRESLFRTRMHGAVKWRDGNCRREGAARTKQHQPQRALRITKDFIIRLSLPSCDFVSLVVTRFGRKARGDLYLRFALRLSKESGASYFAQAYIPTQPAQAIEDTRISHAHEDPGRQESNFPPSRQGAQAGLGETRFPRIIPWRGENAAPIRCEPDHLATLNVALVTWK